MIGARYARVAFVGLLAAMLSACGSDESEEVSSVGFDDEYASVLPSKYGLYAIQDGQLGRLDGERSFQVETWESRSALQPDVQFIVFDRALDDRSVRLQNAIEMRRLAHVRNDVSATGAVTPTGRDIWVVADLPDQAVPLDFAPVPGRPDMIRAVPSRALEPGLYALEFRHGDSVVSGRFGVGWGEVDKDAYIAANCVDRYAGQNTTYRLCSDAPSQMGAFEPLAPQPSLGTLAPSAGSQSGTAPPAQGAAAAAPGSTLELRQVQATKADDQGVQILTVQGIVVNVSNDMQPVPRLVATIKDMQGAALNSWSFAAEVTHLPPGGTTGFRTETIYTTSQPTNVSVTFARTTGS
jgi:hypothetical protein